MVSCKECVDLLLDFLEDNLKPELRDGLMHHFKDCPPCLHFIDTYKKTSSLCKKTLMKEAPREFADRLSSFLREQCNKSGKKRT